MGPLQPVMGPQLAAMYTNVIGSLPIYTSPGYETHLFPVHSSVLR